MVSGINSIQSSVFQPQISQRQTAVTDTYEPLTSFDIEDEAIISSQANMLNELDKFNAGDGNLVNLAVASVMAEITAKAEATVIQAKMDMFDAIVDMVE